jgi:putative spermidine/putrescine transport system ATP-binding protein
MTASLHLTDVSRTHAGALAPVLSDLNLHVAAGDAVAILGPSGSGKTTVLRLVAGLDTPDTGDIWIDGASVLTRPPEQRGIAMVAQRPRLFPHMSVLDNVAFGPLMTGASRREARRQAEQYLDLVQLPGLARRRPSTLSGGQQQRIALARALAASPAVLLLDEPFSALDPSLRADMHQLLLELRALLQPTIVLVTHDSQEAVLLADTIAVLIDGQVHQQGTARQLYEQPASITVSRFLGCLNEIPGEVVSGYHLSALGQFPVPQAEHLPDGPATLVIRQEAVRLVDPTSTVATVIGRVERIVPLGARSLVEVATNVGPLFAEASSGQDFRRGDTIGMVFPTEQCVLLPDQARTAAPPDAATPVRTSTSGSSRHNSTFSAGPSTEC